MARGSSKKRRLDLTSVAGVPIAIGLIVLGQWIEGGALRSLLQTAAALIVFGGTLGAVLMSFSVADVRHAAASLGSVFFEARQTADETIEEILRYARVARKDGILALEDEAADAKDPLLRKGLMLAVDGLNPKTLREMLEVDLDAAEERDLVPARVFESAGGYSPSASSRNLVSSTQLAPLMHLTSTLSPSLRMSVTFFTRSVSSSEM